LSFQATLQHIHKTVHFTHTIYSVILWDSPWKKDYFAKMH